MVAKDYEDGCDDCGELSGHEEGCPVLCPVCQARERERVSGFPSLRYRRCAECEDGEPDGEAFRGGEAAAFIAEEQARIQRELK